MNNELAFGSKTLKLLLINKLSANIKDNKDLTKDGDTSIKISQTVEVLKSLQVF